MKITNLYAMEILDSRGFPTVEVHIQNSFNQKIFASSPSGASTGSLEAVEIRDNDQKRFKGKGVKTALDIINKTVSKELINKDFSTQKDFDDFLIKLDHSDSKKNLGGNNLIALSIAFAKLKAIEENIFLWEFIAKQFNKNHIKQGGLNLTMPAPMINIINGGKHGDNDINIQEFMIMPVNCSDFSGAIDIGGNIFHALKDILKSKNFNINVGDEGGFAPNLKNSREAIEILIKAINKAGYKEGVDVLIALDCASSEFYDQKTRSYKVEKFEKDLSSDKLIDYYRNLIRDYPIFSLEDPLAEYDLDGLNLMTQDMKDKIQIVGDDIFVTNLNIFKERENLCNAILIKPNQIGTVTETVQMVDYACLKNFNCIASHRSGETEETFIADFAFGSFCNQIKTGSLSRTDRNAKYNQLLRIEQYLKNNNLSTKFAGEFILNEFQKYRIN